MGEIVSVGWVSFHAFKRLDCMVFFDFGLYSTLRLWLIVFNLRNLD